MSGSFYFGFDNRAIGATLTASSAASGFEAVNATTWDTYSAWQPTSTSAQSYTIDLGSAASLDSFGIAGHNLFSCGATVELQHSPDGATWTTVVSAITVASDEPLFRRFAAVSKRYWKLNFTSTSIFTIANIFVGVSFAMPKAQAYGGSIAPYNKMNKAMSSRTRTGVLLGRSLKYLGGKLSFQFNNVDSSWVRSNWEAFYDNLMTQAFYVAYDTTNYPSEVAYAWVSDDINPPTWKTSLLVDFTLEFETL